MKRQLLVTLIILFLCSIDSTAFAGPFADVPAKHWAYDAVNKLAIAGIVEGYEGNTFQGNKMMTRYEMAFIVGKALEHTDKADATNKMLIDKLATEFAQELKTLGIRVTTVEQKVNDLSKTTIKGDIYVRNLFYSAKNTSNNTSGSLWRTRARINFENQTTDDITVFARFAARNTFGTDAIFSSGTSGGTNENYQSLDQYGLRYSKDNLKISLGRQAAFLGQGMILCTGSDVEWDNKFNGLIASTKIGVLDTNIIMGMTNADPLLAGNRTAQWYGFDLKGKLADNLSLGYAFAHSKPTGQVSANYQALNLSYNPSAAFVLNAEFGKSNATTDNKASIIGGTYSWGKNSFTAQYLKIANNASDPYNSVYSRIGMPVYGAGLGSQHSFQGWDFVLTHSLNKVASLNFYYIDAKDANLGGKTKDGFVELAVKF